jgi:chromosome partitioning protein
MTKVIVFFNQKGGVGKSTLALNVAHDLSMRGYRTIAIDNDPQGNMSAVLRGKEEVLANSQTKQLYNAAPVSFQPVRDNLWLTNADLSLYDHQDDERGLVEFAENIRKIQSRGICDYIVIDCNPSLTALTKAAILAGTHWIIPIKSERWSIDGLSQANEAIRAMGRNFPNLFVGKFLGFVINQYKKNTQEHRRYRNTLRKKYESYLFQNYTSDSVHFASALSRNKTIFEFSPGSNQVLEVSSITSEIIEKVED